MTYRKILGLSFKVHSPSLFELNAYDDDSSLSLVSVALVGRQWYIDILMKAGHSHHRGPFRTRDDAIALLAERQTHVA